MKLPRPRRQPLTRREALGLLGGAAAGAMLPGCGGGGYNGGYGGSTTYGMGMGMGYGDPGANCTAAATETNGPFPADGTNTDQGTLRNVLTDARAFRVDIRGDFDGTNTQPGTPLTLTMTLKDSNNACALLPGYYVYIWHCNASGNYSQYSGTMNGGDFSAHTFLRGIGQTDANGQVTFTTIFPGRYAGRATHIHVEAYPDNTPQYSEARSVTQLAFPDAITDGSGSPYANTTLYPNSAANDTTNASDNVFSDGTSTELLNVSGDNTNGYTATITIAVPA